ncbi:unnamed protein product [Pleuronectes platessa]|uniref:Uncharacterized protein n=1 Tax=Pleuronectes platessa TaxID=8262 RepID=A0A9N7U413_PLEPL|nr:unnamed protein product [Pleuronectes platessa]
MCVKPPATSGSLDINLPSLALAPRGCRSSCVVLFPVDGHTCDLQVVHLAAEPGTPGPAEIEPPGFTLSATGSDVSLQRSARTKQQRQQAETPAEDKTHKQQHPAHIPPWEQEQTPCTDVHRAGSLTAQGPAGAATQMGQMSRNSAAQLDVCFSLGDDKPAAVRLGMAAKTDEWGMERRDKDR